MDSLLTYWPVIIGAVGIATSIFAVFKAMQMTQAKNAWEIAAAKEAQSRHEAQTDRRLNELDLKVSQLSGETAEIKISLGKFQMLLENLFSTCKRIEERMDSKEDRSGA